MSKSPALSHPAALSDLDTAVYSVVIAWTVRQCEPGLQRDLIAKTQSRSVALIDLVGRVREKYLVFADVRESLPVPSPVPSFLTEVLMTFNLSEPDFLSDGHGSPQVELPFLRGEVDMVTLKRNHRKSRVSEE